MKGNTQPPSSGSPRLVRLAGIALVGSLLLLLVNFLRPPPPAPPDDPARSSTERIKVGHSNRSRNAQRTRSSIAAAPARPAEEIVAQKVSQFARNRKEIVAAMARQLNLVVPEEVNRFFAAAEAGRWEETTNLFAAVQTLRYATNAPPGLEALMPAVKEMFGVAEQTHLWPAQQLLDYGHAVLDALRPGMVYVGGNDAGQFIPLLLTETGDAESHIVLSQNALADSSYLDYLTFRYADRLDTLTADESQSAFQSYMADARKRMEHDQQFPNEPRQVRPGEYIAINDGRFQASGQVAVMAINERLLQTLLQKNPSLSFALEESFPLQSFYSDATTLGPVTELRAGDTADALSPERASQSLDYWRQTTLALLCQPSLGAVPRDAYVKQILGQANLLVNQKYLAEAEQAFQLATSLSPANPALVFSYANLLIQQQRFDEARKIVQAAATAAPDNQEFRHLATDLGLGRMK